ncbi:hypothetical protein AL387_gp025 [Salmon gill poxvirus]|uniref:Uncharacterized protein n=1 Tax=Salmon gill poxvirus TaxID=1680908 RepID=A0A0H4YFE8_9POXV|nr:hypothetical protein AL387_gp025 [Salmon gill poxvirus]AKR04149.1 hypothetical protein SGPV025 [Salmon gill poxvirus]WMX26433.1 hypothetical protein [Salmon gill poxvirus]
MSVRYLNINPFMLNMSGYTLICPTKLNKSEILLSSVLQYYSDPLSESKNSNLILKQFPVTDVYIVYMLMNNAPGAIKELIVFSNTNKIKKICLPMSPLMRDYWDMIENEFKNIPDHDIIICYTNDDVQFVRDRLVKQHNMFPGIDHELLVPTEYNPQTPVSVITDSKIVLDDFINPEALLTVSTLTDTDLEIIKLLKNNNTK